ncbi:MAG: type-F conjugative transfer system pilin assembly protein TrbC [Sodalis sp. (in: enterobacteria)]|uniref:type-F conjugative transfer system pilin assembly protein TrbC n=1 Tax=Sodalis sp. (in: enterobacteria) TaxID=1898979 RepID=UPI0039E39B13
MNIRLRTGVIVGVLLLAASVQASSPAPDDGTAVREDTRAWLTQQEHFSQWLREHAREPDFLQVPRPPLSVESQTFIDGLTEKQRQVSAAPLAEGALYFVSLSLPSSGLRQMLQETKRFAIPATLRGMVNNRLPDTVQAVMALVGEGDAEGVHIDPQPFRDYGIRSVPALVVYCPAGFDVLRGNLHLEAALKKMAATGDCASTAKALLVAGGVRE